MTRVRVRSGPMHSYREMSEKKIESRKRFRKDQNFESGKLILEAADRKRRFSEKARDQHRIANQIR
jgi:hypothetical protein